MPSGLPRADQDLWSFSAPWHLLPLLRIEKNNIYGIENTIHYVYYNKSFSQEDLPTVFAEKGRIVSTLEELLQRYPTEFIVDYLTLHIPCGEVHPDKSPHHHGMCLKLNKHTGKHDNFWNPPWGEA